MVYEKIVDVLTNKTSCFSLTEQDFRTPVKSWQSYWKKTNL